MDLTQASSAKASGEDAVLTHTQLLPSAVERKRSRREAPRRRRACRGSHLPPPWLSAFELCGGKRTFSVLDLGPCRAEREREARARGWSILSSNWLVAPPFITGKEGRPGTRGGRELFHCSFPRAEEPAARLGNTPWGTRNVCAYWGRG